MAYRFKMDETVEAGLRRIAREQIDEALAVIAAAGQPPERMVHEVRRRCKALRALIRLVRPDFPEFDRENAAFRDIARALAGMRDSKVLVDTLDDLAGEPVDEAAQRVTTRLRKRFARPGAKADAVGAALEACAGQLRAARERVVGWTLEAQGWAALSPGFAKTIGSARRAMAALADTDNAECSHEWRKHVKYHWHHARLLRPVGGEGVADRIRTAERLAALLGERHDLDLFAETLAVQPRRGADGATLDFLVGKARKRAAKLEAKAGQLGGRLFDEKPRKVAAKWGGRWRSHVEEKAFA